MNWLVSERSSSRLLRVSGPSSSCVWNPRVFADDARGWQCPFVLCLHPQGCLRRGVRASGSYQERTGRLGRSARGTSQVASLEFPPETGLILRCTRKAGNPFQRKQGNRLSFRDQEGRRGSDEVVPGPSVFPSREPSVSGNFCGRIKVVKYRLARKDGTWDFPGDARNFGFPLD